MQKHLPDSPAATTVLWMWLGCVVLAFAAYFGVRRWKQRHPPPKPEPILSYSQRLRRRMNKPRSKANRPHADKTDKH